MVDGLDPDADDVRRPGDYIEEEMVPYIDRAISGRMCTLRISLIQHGARFLRLLSCKRKL